MHKIYMRRTDLPLGRAWIIEAKITNRATNVTHILTGILRVSGASVVRFFDQTGQNRDVAHVFISGGARWRLTFFSCRVTNVSPIGLSQRTSNVHVDCTHTKTKCVWLLRKTCVPGSGQSTPMSSVGMVGVVSGVGSWTDFARQRLQTALRNTQNIRKHVVVYVDL